MKRFGRFRAGRAALLAAGLLGLALSAIAQNEAAISARPGGRTPRALPEATAEGMRLSLSEAVALAVANNQDLNVSVYTSEASRYVLFSNMGIFDLLAEASLVRSHAEQPAATQLSGAQVDQSV